MKRWTPKAIATEAKLLLIGIPVLLWTLIPVYHMALFAFSTKDSATSGHLWPTTPTLAMTRTAHSRSQTTMMQTNPVRVLCARQTKSIADFACSAADEKRPRSRASNGRNSRNRGGKPQRALKKGLITRNTKYIVEL